MKAEVLNVSFGKTWNEDLLAGDLRQKILEYFWKHKKDVPQSAIQKVHNTEALLRFLKMTFHD